MSQSKTRKAVPPGHDDNERKVPRVVERPYDGGLLLDFTKGLSGPKTQYNTDRFREDYIWDRSSSEPNLSVPQQIHERWPIKFPHEFISVDELKFFRRKPPPHGLAALHTNSSICLFNKDEPVFPFSYVKSEYERQYQNHLPILRPGLTRKSTSLKLDGFIDGVTEQKAKYLRYPQEEILRCRASPTRYPQNLTLSGDLDLEPEYKSSYISHPSTTRSTKVPPRKTLKLEGIMDVCKKDIHITQPKERLIGQPAIKVDPPKCQLKLEGEMSYVPEYRSQYIQFPIEKSHSIPQLSNIKFQGDFTGIAEYTESFKFYDNYSKSAPIKKADHIILKGKIDAVPEYKEKFKEPNISSGEKAVSLKTEDHLQPNGEFGKDLPEYYESFKDPHITKMPERGRCREPYLRLKGKIEFNPEYRSTYLDYPRSRPIVQKSVSSLRLSNSSKSPFDTPKRKFKSISPKKFHDPNVDIPIACQPEYRKAKHDYQIRERPLARKITEGDSNGKTTGKSYKTSGLTGRRGSDRNSKISPRKRESSPKFKLKVEHFDDVGDTTHKSAPKFGRRASVSRNAHNIREKTGIIEGNQKYVKGPGVNISSRKKHGADDQSFLVLQEPCKKSSWMEKSWYET